MPLRPETRRTPRIDQRRNDIEILQAAARLLAADPGTSMQAIADSAGVTRLTVYRHFANRQALGVALQQTIDAHAVAMIEDLPDWGAGPSTFRHLVTGLVDLVRTYPVIIAQHQVETGEGRSPIDGQLSEVLHRGQSSGVLRDDLPPDVINATLFAVIAAHTRLRPHLPSTHLADSIADLLLDGLAPHAAQRRT